VTVRRHGRKGGFVEIECRSACVFIRLSRKMDWQVEATNTHGTRTTDAKHNGNVLARDSHPLDGATARWVC
jgi:hypothetical protein